MPSKVIEIFEDKELAKRIKEKLPHLFQLAELESSRAGKIGMEVGVLRERIIVALLIHKFGEANVETEIPTTEPEIDVNLFGEPISIKTITGGLSGVKLIWTVDAQKAKEFRESYYPTCDMLLIQIKWDGIGGFHCLPIESQKKLIEDIGRDNYIKLPKPRTNPRGVEITKDALTKLVSDEMTKSIEIQWRKGEVDFNPYKRWLDHWRED